MFDPQQVKQFKEAFSMIDQDGDGRVTEEDLRVMLSSLGGWQMVLQIRDSICSFTTSSDRIEFDIWYRSDTITYITICAPHGPIRKSDIIDQLYPVPLDDGSTSPAA